MGKVPSVWLVNSPWLIEFYTTDCPGQSAKEVLKVLQSSLLQANTWLNTSRLVVNASKSSFMLQDNTKNSGYLQDIILNNVKLEHTSTKLLGLLIHTALAWKEHIASVAKSLSSKIGLFLRLSKFLNLIYPANYVLHLSFLTWNTVLWGNCPPSHTDILQKLQNRLARIITKYYNYQIGGLDIVKQLGWMNVKERYQYFVAAFMFKYYHGALQPDLRHSFLRVLPLVVYHYQNHVLSFKSSIFRSICLE